jgi:hypothetical protein
MRDEHQEARRRAAPAVLAAALLPLLALASPRPAQAALGERMASISGDQAQLAGSLRTIELAGYSLHQIEAATGTLVREFASPDGVVFGIAWDGPFLPDLRQLLGASFDTYTQAVRAKRRGRGPLLIYLPELVFESAGHPRGFHGRAYLPQRLPAGFSAESIR